MKAPQRNVENPTSLLPLAPPPRRSARKSASTPTLSLQAGPEAVASMRPNDTSTQGMEGNRESSLAVLNSPSGLRRSSRKSNPGKSTTDQVDTNVQDLNYLEGDLKVRGSSRKTRSRKKVQSDSELQGGEDTGDTDTKEERQGDKDSGMFCFDARAIMDAERCKNEDCKEIPVNDEQEKSETGRSLPPQDSANPVQQKNLADVFEREAVKKVYGFSEENNGEARLQLPSTESDGEARLQLPSNESDGQTHLNDLETSPSITLEALVEEGNSLSCMNGNVKDSEADDEEMAVLFSKSLRFQLLENSMSSAKCFTEDHISQDIRTMEASAIVAETTTSHLDGRRPRIRTPSVSSLKVSWSPSCDLPFLDDKQYAGKKSGPGKDGIILSSKGAPQPQGFFEGKLQDGLFVPPNNTRKLKKILKREDKDTAGDKWFNMPAPTMTPDLKKELQLLKLRAVINPKRHYKAEDSKTLPKYFQIGTVVETPADFFSGRLTKKERKASFADELLSDIDLARYRKRKYSEIQDIKQAGRKNFWKKKKNRRKPSWAKV